MSEDKVNDFPLPEDANDLTGDGGVFKRLVQPGVGDETPGSGDQVFVHYTGTLFGGDRHGEKFDSSRDRGDPFSFKLDSGNVIKGWDKCVETMTKGEKCEVFLKPDYAYGAGGAGSIPPNANLKFEIELLRWAGDDITDAKDEGVLKSRVRNGEGYTSPNDCATVDIHIKGTLGDRIFDERDVKFELGTYEEVNLCIGVEMALKKMHKGEVARVTVKPAYAFGAEGCPALNIPPDSTVDYSIELKDFEKAKEAWEMNTTEKISQSELLKVKGTEYFKKGKLKMAQVNYKRVVDYLEWDTDFEKESDETKEQRKQLILASRLNLALVYNKLGNYRDSITQCDEALKVDPNSEKAYFRRGQANFAVREFHEAKGDFEATFKISKSGAAAQQIQLCLQKIREEKEKEKKTFFGMFDKFASKDSKDVRPADDTNGVAPSGEAVTEPAA